MSKSQFRKIKTGFVVQGHISVELKSVNSSWNRSCDRLHNHIVMYFQAKRLSKCKEKKKQIEGWCLNLATIWCLDSSRVISREEHVFMNFD